MRKIINTKLLRNSTAVVRLAAVLAAVELVLGAFGIQVSKVITLELNERQAKILLILTGNQAGAVTSCGVFDKLCLELGVNASSVPDVRIGPNNAILIDLQMLEQIH